MYILWHNMNLIIWLVSCGACIKVCVPYLGVPPMLIIHGLSMGYMCVLQHYIYASYTSMMESCSLKVCWLFGLKNWFVHMISIGLLCFVCCYALGIALNGRESNWCEWILLDHQFTFTTNMKHKYINIHMLNLVHSWCLKWCISYV